MPALQKAYLFATLPPIWPTDVLPEIRQALATAPRTLVVLDDDPTGTQTVRDIAVVTTWDVATLRAELTAAPTCFYILTNSRSLSAEASRTLHRELAENLRAAAAGAKRDIAVASRSDSTLRGYYPLETDTLAETLGPFDATLITPYFEAGGRYTLNDTHYVAEGDRLVPAAETPFARDAAFGFCHSHLPSWVEEKTAGRIRAADVATIPLDLIRRGGPAAVAAKLRALPGGSVCIVNACAPRDIEVIAAATLIVENSGARFLYRTAASFVAARIGQAPQGLLAAEAFSAHSAHGGLIVVGSHVPKTTGQLDRLLAFHDLAAIELSVGDLLDPARRTSALSRAGAAANTALAAGRDTVVFTSRALVAGADAAASLAIGRRVSDALITIVQGLTATPRYLIAKGGITSSDIATHGLGVRRALVLGQALPGVPVWRLGPETKFPGLGYVVFPGNVGGDAALADLVTRLQLPRPAAGRKAVRSRLRSGHSSVKEDSAPRPTGGQPDQPPTMPNPQKILLIDDDPTMAEMIGFMVSAFRRGPFVLEHVADYASGLRSLLSGAYALCLLDYNLGSRDGLELLREAKAHHCLTPIILLTGDSREDMDMAAMDGGAVDFMDKTELNPRGLERAVYYTLKMAAALAQLRELVAQDELTQVLNRREFDRRLHEEWQRGIRFQRPLALVMMDLDRFKLINDTHGHPVGDEVLRHVANLLAGQIRQVDCLARYGGDEFALIMVETDHKSAQGAAARLRELAAASPCLIPAKHLTIEIGISTGVAAWPEDADKLHSLVAAADAALYDSKRLGRNPVVSGSP